MTLRPYLRQSWLAWLLIVSAVIGVAWVAWGCHVPPAVGDWCPYSRTIERTDVSWELVYLERIGGWRDSTCARRCHKGQP